MCTLAARLDSGFQTSFLHWLVRHTFFHLGALAYNLSTPNNTLHFNVKSYQIMLLLQTGLKVENSVFLQLNHSTKQEIAISEIFLYIFFKLACRSNENV